MGDGNSRTDGEGTHNYVVFADEDIEIAEMLFQSDDTAESADNGSMWPPNLKDNIEKVLNGTPEERKALEMSYFYMATTPLVLKKHGLTGDYFSVRYGVIARHKGKDVDHALTSQNWIDLCDEITRPFAVVKHKNGYRMLVNIKVDGNFVAVGVEVKNTGENLEINSIFSA